MSWPHTVLLLWSAVVRELKGPFNDPSHPYMYDEADMWQAPGFVNEFSEVRCHTPRHLPPHIPLPTATHPLTYRHTARGECPHSLPSDGPRALSLSGQRRDCLSVG